LRTSDHAGSPAGTASSLIHLGWDDAHEAAFDSLALADATPGRVSRADRGGAVVYTERGQVRTELDPDLDDTPTTGDWVAVTGGLVVAVLPRRTQITRRDPNVSTFADQVLAANVDVVAVVHALDRPFRPARIERTLVVAWESGAVPAVVLTKADLADDADGALAVAQLVSPGVHVVLTSAEDGRGIELLRATVVAPGRTVVFLGASGAGKSRLVNALAGRELQDVGDVRSGDAKGRHTTTTRDLIVLPDGGVVIDTPGLRALGLWSGDGGLDRTFPEIEALAGQCRFRDCSHGPEPGCAVRAAIDRGDVGARRLESYRKLQREMEYMSGEKKEHERRAEARSFNKLVRHHRDSRPR